MPVRDPAYHNKKGHCITEVKELEQELETSDYKTKEKVYKI